MNKPPPIAQTTSRLLPPTTAARPSTPHIHPHPSSNEDTLLASQETPRTSGSGRTLSFDTESFPPLPPRTILPVVATTPTTTLPGDHGLAPMEDESLARRLLPDDVVPLQASPSRTEPAPPQPEMVAPVDQPTPTQFALPTIDAGTGNCPSTISPRHYVYVNVKATFPSKLISAIKEKLGECLEVLVGMDMGFQLCCFDPSDNLPPVTAIGPIGHHLTQLKRYFFGISLNPTSWSQWRISWASSQSTSYTDLEFLSEVNALVAPLQFICYKKRLQAPHTTTVGWIFKTSDRTNCDDLHTFLASELRRVGFHTPFALYHKVPFAGAAQPDSTPTYNRSPAIHVDTIVGSQLILYQRLKNLLKSDRMNSYTNWKWKLFPPFRRDMDPRDQRELHKVIAKQKILKQSIASCVINTLIDLDSLLSPSTTVRAFLLAQKTGVRRIVLGLDRDPSQPSSFLATSSIHLRSDLSALTTFLPIHLTHQFGQQGQDALSEEGLFLLEDQYWDHDENCPRSKFSDDLRNDHEEDAGDIVIVLENLPSALLTIDQRPLDTPFAMDSDNITHASFNTIGHSRPPTEFSPSGAAATSSPMARAPSTRITPNPQETREASLQREVNALRTQLSSLQSGLLAGHSGGTTIPPNGAT